MPGRKKKPSHSGLRLWLETLGEEVQKKRGDEKQEAFARRIGVSTKTLSIIETGARPYGVDALYRVLSALSADPMKELLRKKYPSHNPRHIELHEQLQELLDAKPEPGRNWPEAAEVNVDAVWSLYQVKKKKSAQ